MFIEKNLFVYLFMRNYFEYLCVYKKYENSILVIFIFNIPNFLVLQQFRLFYEFINIINTIHYVLINNVN